MCLSLYTTMSPWVIFIVAVHNDSSTLCCYHLCWCWIRQITARVLKAGQCLSSFSARTILVGSSDPLNQGPILPIVCLLRHQTLPLFCLFVSASSTSSQMVSVLCWVPSPVSSSLATSSLSSTKLCRMQAAVMTCGMWLMSQFPSLWNHCQENGYYS